MSGLRDAFRDAWRSWVVSLRRGGNSISVILTLALAIAATTATFTLVKDMLTVLPYQHANRLVMLWEAARPPGPDQLRVSVPDYLDFVGQNRSFESLGIFAPQNHNLFVGDHVERVFAPQIGTGFFSTLGVRMLKGRGAHRDDSNVVLLSERLWHRQFGNWEDPVGRTVKVDGVDHQIIGIVPRGQEFPPGADMWLPFFPTLATCACERNGHSYKVIGRLRNDVSISQADAEIRGIAARLAAQYPDTNKAVTAWVKPLRDELMGDVAPALWILGATTMSLFLMACIAVGSILVARGTYRASEIAMRQVLGATHRRIVMQMLLESSFSALAASLLGSLFAWWVLRLFLRILPDSLPQLQTISIDPVSVGFAGILALITVLIFSVRPSWHATRLNPIVSIRGIEVARMYGNPRQRRGALIVLENAFAFTLLVTSVLLLNSLLHLTNIDPGFGVRGIVAADLNLDTPQYATPEQTVAFFNVLLGRVRHLPGVTAAAVINSLPMTGSTEGTAYYPADRIHNPGQEWNGRVSYVSPEYFKTMSIPLLRGRDFTGSDGLHSHVVVISDGIARANWPNQDPIGKKIGLRGSDGLLWQVIGVVPDVKDDGLAEASRPRIYFNEQEAAEKEMTLVASTTGDTASTSASLRAVVHQLDPDLPVYNNTTVEEIVSRTYARNRTVARIVGTFSIMALVLAAFGTYGALLANMLRRTREFSIRIAIGCPYPHICWLVLHEGVLLAIVGILAGSALSTMSSHLLARFLVGVGGTDIPSFAVAAFIQLAALAAGSLVVLRMVSKLDPVAELRDR